MRPRTDTLAMRAPGSSILFGLLAALALTACGDDTEGAGGGGDGGATSASTTTGSTSTTTGGDGGSGGAGGGSGACTDSPQNLADCVDTAAYTADLEFVAEVRPPDSPHWQAVQDLCAERLEEYGYEVVRQDYGTGVNVIGRRIGTAAPDQIVVIGAHYDGVPDCAAADDNASGVAATLEIARLLAQVDFERTTVIAFWDEEEDGLIGSGAHVDEIVAADEDVIINYTFDTIGFRSTEPNSQTVPDGFSGVFPDAYDAVEANDFRGDFIAVISNASAEAQAELVADGADRIGLAQHVLKIPNGLENTAAFGDLSRSDHARFWAAGYPAVFITDTADFRNDHYHCLGGPDEVADLDIEFAVGVTKATLEASAIALGM